MLLTTRDENGELNTPFADSKLIDAVTDSPKKLPVNTVSGAVDVDRDSGVAIELNGYDGISNI